MGIRADVSVDDTGACQITPLTAGGGCIDSVTRSARATEEGVVEEFTYDGDPGSVPDEMEPAFEFGDSTLYRFTREESQHCVCDTIERLGAPVREFRAERDRLHVSFVVADIERLRSVVGAVKERFDGVTVRRLVHTGDNRNAEDVVVVDRGALTERQTEVMRVAHRLGYFEHPKEANASEVAAELDIAVSTFAEHLAAAQSKLLAAVLAD